jgi:D-arabinono-1,4-lactone oxidase/FAD binding domain
LILENFGKNVRFAPALVVTPSDKNAVLACLKHYRHKKIRAVGRLHSWSDAVVCHDIVLDLRLLDTVALQFRGDGSVEAEIDAGCTIGRALDYLRAHGGFTLPTLGMIKTQTIAGAIATATHGTGRASLSHYVSAISVAAYDPQSGEARIYEWEGGPELEAARCGLGCTGIILSVRMHVEPEYLMEERTQWFQRIEEVLEQEAQFPRQQFYLIPWSWRWFAQLRRGLLRDVKRGPAVVALAHRILRFIGVDVTMNGIVRLLSGSLQWPSATRWHFRRLFPLFARSGMRVTDRSSYAQTMRHDLYTHVEMELFVPAQHVVHAASYVEWVLRCCGGESLPLPEILSNDEFGRDIIGEIEVLRGRYVHDHPITFRRVLTDDALISMTSGHFTDAWYAMSLVTYQRDHRPFLEVARFVAVTMAAAYFARPHWGKICPLHADEIAKLYPNLVRFRAHCASIDPHEVFVNDFARRVLGF